MLVGGILGGVVYFFLGWLVYGILLADFMAQYSNASCSRPMEEMLMPYMIVGNLGYGLLLSYVLSQSPKFASLSGGATGGAIVALLMSLAIDCMMYSTSTLMNSPTGIIVDIAIGVVMGAAVGSVIGWWLGRK